MKSFMWNEKVDDSKKVLDEEVQRISTHEEGDMDVSSVQWRWNHPKDHKCVLKENSIGTTSLVWFSF